MNPFCGVSTAKPALSTGITVIICQRNLVALLHQWTGKRFIYPDITLTAILPVSQTVSSQPKPDGSGKFRRLLAMATTSRIRSYGMPLLDQRLRIILQKGSLFQAPAFSSLLYNPLLSLYSTHTLTSIILEQVLCTFNNIPSAPEHCNCRMGQALGQ